MWQPEGEGQRELDVVARRRQARPATIEQDHASDPLRKLDGGREGDKGAHRVTAEHGAVDAVCVEEPDDIARMGEEPIAGARLAGVAATTEIGCEHAYVAAEGARQLREGAVLRGEAVEEDDAGPRRATATTTDDRGEGRAEGVRVERRLGCTQEFRHQQQGHAIAPGDVRTRDIGVAPGSPNLPGVASAPFALQAVRAASGSSGNRTVNTLPSPSRERTVMLPSWAATNCWQMNKPRPRPCCDGRSRCST